MLRWLVLIAAVYLLFKLIQGPKRRRNHPNRFNDFFKENKSNGSRKNSRLDHIEEAEFEDITDKEKKNDNS